MYRFKSNAGGHNVGLIRQLDNRLRKSECLELQENEGITEDIELDVAKTVENDRNGNTISVTFY